MSLPYASAMPQSLPLLRVQWDLVEGGEDALHHVPHRLAEVPHVVPEGLALGQLHRVDLEGLGPGVDGVGYGFYDVDEVVVAEHLHVVVRALGEQRVATEQNAVVICDINDGGGDGDAGNTASLI